MSTKKATSGPRARRPPPKPTEGLRVRAGGPGASGEGAEEVRALIATLHETGMRLEELTAGEVDSVSDRLGRPLLLRHAQEELRHAEAVRQAAILNALPAHIALLDLHGRILSVNETWRRFGDENGFRGPDHGVGLDYLEVCVRARGKDAEGAREAAEGIRSVLGGGAASFSARYPCHSPEQERWFLLMVTPLVQEEPRGAVVVHVDVTAERLADDRLRESERRFREMLENVEMVSVMLDRELRITYCNEYLLRLTGWRREELLGRSCFETLISSDRGDMKGFFATLLANAPGAGHHENEILTRAGERRLVRWNNSMLRSKDGEVIGIASLGEDVTEQKRAEVRIRRLNRVYAVLSSISSLIVRAQDRNELFREACRIAVEVGGFRMSLVGVVDPVTRRVEPVASAGKDEELLSAIGNRLLSGAKGAGTMVAQAIREGRPVVANDSQSDPRVVFARQYAEAGVRSIAVLPLMVAGGAAGVLALYSVERGFFHEDEMKLLSELTGDVSLAMDHIEKKERLDYLAYYDALTGLANRALFLERVGQYVRGAASGPHQLAVLLIDLERFRNINDSLGRPAGDALLRQVSNVLTRLVGNAGLLARVGADHFAAVLPEVKGARGAARLLEKAAAAFLEHPFRLDDAVFRIAARAGVALFPEDGAVADVLLRNAEAALKKAKRNGERYVFYAHGMCETASGKPTLESHLREALEKGEFVLHYQPKVSLVTGGLTGTEALIRWKDPRTGLVPPGRFIPVLEETGLIHDVGRWALGKALEDYLRWKGAGLPAVRVAVNVSPLQLRSRSFTREIALAVGSGGRAAAGLELEVTESLIMEDVKYSIGTLQTIRAMGVTVAIDDFGTGFSSLSYLSRLPVDSLKIDRSFVTDMTAGPEGLSLVSTIINLAHSLKLNVVAEGVESEEQARLLRLLGCDEMQGFLVSRALPAELFGSRFLAPPAG